VVGAARVDDLFVGGGVEHADRVDQHRPVLEYAQPGALVGGVERQRVADHPVLGDRLLVPENTSPMNERARPPTRIVTTRARPRQVVEHRLHVPGVQQRLDVLDPGGSARRVKASVTA
jgi:hypothetical protein